MECDDSKSACPAKPNKQLDDSFYKKIVKNVEQKGVGRGQS